MLSKENFQIVKNIELANILDSQMLQYDRIFTLVTNDDDEEVGMVAERSQLKLLMTEINKLDEGGKTDLIECLYVLLNSLHGELVYFQDAYGDNL